LKKLLDVLLAALLTRVKPTGGPSTKCNGVWYNC